MGKLPLGYVDLNNQTKWLYFNSREVNQKLLDLAYHQAQTGFLASFACTAIVLVGLWQPEHNGILISWYLFSVVIIAFRSIITGIYTHQKTPEKKYRLWRRLFIVSTSTGGLSWGLLGTILFNDATSMQQMLIILVVSGVTAGSVPLNSGVKSASFGFLSLTLLPLITNLLIVKSEISLIFDLTLMTYYLYMLSLTFKTYRVIQQSFSLQFENHALLTSLTNAKNALEDTNVKLKEAATHDPLTHVANRNLFNTNFELAILMAKQKQKSVALFFIDLDEFKEVNDIYGHHTGDEVLLIVISRLKSICKEKDNISRLGGDEFTVILENINHVEDISCIANRLCDSIAQSIKIGDAIIKISASIGISIYPIDGQDPDQLLRDADKRMYEVKQKGGNGFLFQSGLHTF
jgi:diguanylate cyclase (GGDEF)-like protein